MQLMVAVEESKQTVYDWMFRLFRQQHKDKFLSSFHKLGLADLPHAVACAKYHVLSNGIGGVEVEYTEESNTKVWVRFRYPRWMYAGPAICGIPVEAGRGFLQGWYAQNGVSLNNPRLGFVCVSEDVTGQFGLCGYFQEYANDLSPEERLRFAPNEQPPKYDPAKQPKPPTRDWSEERLLKANRNYALEYVRNGLSALTEVLGRTRALELLTRAARLTGLQQHSQMAKAVGATDGDTEAAASFLSAMMSGMGDTCTRTQGQNDERQLIQHGLRVARGLEPGPREDLLHCWVALWQGALQAYRSPKQLTADITDQQIIWTIS